MRAHPFYWLALRSFSLFCSLQFSIPSSSSSSSSLIYYSYKILPLTTTSSPPQQAKRYILDPLTAPEPSQETGLGSSHYNPRRSTAASPAPPSPARPISIVRPTPHPANLPASPPRHPKSSPSPRHRPAFYRRRTNDSDFDNDDGLVDPFADYAYPSASNFFNNPTPPDSADKPSRLPHHYHPSKPYAPNHTARRVSSPLDTHAEEGIASSSRSPPPVSLTSQHHRYRKPVPNSPPAAGLHRTASARVPGNPPNHAAVDHNRSRSAGYNDPQRRPSASQTLAERYPGDMSHRPLDMLKRESRAADRRHRKRFSETDTIDRLDTIGPAYHHGGPFDATLASRNQNKMYSPVAAVRESNMAALRATPRQYIDDSLKRHHPLQGTAILPPGEVDVYGNVMDYEEGADLMREPDAEGGPYKRWDGVVSFLVPLLLTPSQIIH